MFTDVISVVTIVKGRRRQLANLVRGLNACSPLPSELVVGAMDELHREELPAAPYPIRIVAVPQSDTGHLPLARARNAAARASSGETIVFLDVDCIPAPDLLSVLAKACTKTGGVVMGNVRYLAQGHPAAETWTPADLEAASVPHPRRPQPAPGQLMPTENYALLWTLCIALSRETFDRVGGLDDDYTGYGAEDTDFAFKLERAGVPFHLVGATAYHQYHPVYRPPLNYFEDILANSVVFERKWGRWPMEGWLGAFAELGLIEWDAEATAIERLRSPTAAEVDAAFKDTGEGF